MKHIAKNLAPLLGLVALLRCGGDDARPPAGGAAGSSTGAGGSGPGIGDGGPVLVSGGTETSLGGAPGAPSPEAGPATGADAGGQPPPPPDDDDDDEPELPAGPCGNSQLNLGEDCDGPELGALSCGVFGFDSGELSCAADCTADTSGCSGTELCADGYDNDGDGSADCADSDCSEFCSNACLAPIALELPAHVQGDTTGKPALQSASCLPSSGPEVAYAVPIDAPGVLEARLGSARALAVELRQSCSEGGSAHCVLAAPSPLSTPAADTSGRGAKATVSAGETWFVIVDSASASSGGRYELQVESRPLVCGDGHQDPGEACDDGNTSAGDGCSAACAVEANETEPNQTPASASPMVPFAQSFFATIDAIDDQDVIRVELEAGPGVLWMSLRANTFDLGGGACTQGATDTELELLDSAGERLALDQDSGEGRCSQLELPALPAGTYYLVVSRQAGLSDESFPYRLRLNVGQCGDGVVSELEQCDDGNAEAGDGCSDRCESE